MVTARHTLPLPGIHFFCCFHLLALGRPFAECLCREIFVFGVVVVAVSSMVAALSPLLVIVYPKTACIIFNTCRPFGVCVTCFVFIRIRQFALTFRGLRRLQGRQRDQDGESAAKVHWRWRQHRWGKADFGCNSPCRQACFF